jgi:hypothetical protein
LTAEEERWSNTSWTVGINQKTEGENMTTQEKLRRRQSLLELAEYLQNISQAYSIHSVSRQHFYDIMGVYEKSGIEGLGEKGRRKSCVKNWVAPEVEEAVVQIAYEFPLYGQDRAINGFRKKGILVFVDGRDVVEN